MRRCLSAHAWVPGPLLATLLLILPHSARAQDAANHLYDKFEFSASGATVLLSTTFRIDNSDGTRGTELSFDDLGISSSAFSPALGAAWRPGRRHRLVVGYVNVNRSGDKTLTKDIDFSDTTFTAGLQLQTKFSAPTAGLTYQFAFLAKEKVQVGVQAALGVVFFKVGIDAVAGVSSGGADSTIVQYSASESLSGPTAALGLYSEFRAGNHWYFGVNGGAIGATVGNISATSWIFGANARYYLSNHWALGGGWSLTGIKVTADELGSGSGLSTDFTGSIKYSFNVFRLGVTYALP
jgi:hypothetical protein